MNRWVDQYDSVYDVPDTGYEGDYVAVPETGLPPGTTPTVNEPVYGRESPGGYAGIYTGTLEDHPGAYQYQPTGGPELIALIMLIVKLIIILIIAIVIMYVVAKATTIKQVADPGVTTCSDQSTCTSYVVQEGFNYYRWDCCTGAMTKQGGDWLSTVGLIVILAIGGYAAIKILGGMRRRSGGNGYSGGRRNENGNRPTAGLEDIDFVH